MLVQKALSSRVRVGRDALDLHAALRRAVVGAEDVAERQRVSSDVVERAVGCVPVAQQTDAQLLPPLRRRCRALRAADRVRHIASERVAHDVDRLLVLLRLDRPHSEQRAHRAVHPGIEEPVTLSNSPPAAHTAHNQP